MSFVTTNSPIPPFFSHGKFTITSLNSRYLVPSLLVALAFGASVQAQTPSGKATFTDTPVGPNYDYTITLDNIGTTPIETFWFAWVPGENFMHTSPLNGTVQAPSGWTGTVTHGTTTDGYGIEFLTSTTPLAAGNSTTFQFQSADTPAELAGNSVFYSTTPVGTSTIYSGGPFASPTASFVAQPVPEPSALGLLLAGCLWPFANRFVRVARRTD